MNPVTEARGNAGEARRPRRLPDVSPLLLTGLAHGLLWLLVAAAAGAGITSLVLHASSDPARAAVTLPVDTTAAEATAEAFLWAYLGEAGRGQEAILEPFLAEPVDLRAVTARSLYAPRTAVVGSEEMGSGYWAVTVAAEVLLHAGGTYEPAGLRYYTVGVAETPDGLVVTGAPSLVATPVRARAAPRLAVRMIGRPQASEELETAERFLQAYLAGEGELDRYTAPGLHLDPVTPSPYASLQVQRAGLTRRQAGGALVRLEVAAVDGVGFTHVLGYSIDVAKRAGRWEITALHPAAPLSTGAPG